MKTKLMVTLLSTLLFLGILMAGMNIIQVAASSTTLYIDPSSVTKSPSDVPGTFTVSVKIGPVTDLFAFDIKITWDNTLITFSSLDDSALHAFWPNGFFTPLHPDYPPGYVNGPGYVRYVLVAEGSGHGFTGSGTLFTITFNVVKASTYPLSTQIHFDPSTKLSDSNANPIDVTTTDGSYTMSEIPDVEFSTAPSTPFVWGNTFQIEVYLTDVTDLEDYTLVITYDNSLLKLTGVDWTGGVLGGISDGASYTESPAGTITVVDTGGITYTGTGPALLFTLTFQVQFTGDDPTHIWRTNNLGPLYAFIKFTDATLSFVEGTVYKSGITLPADLSIIVNLIQGDVDCNGRVDVFDLRVVAYYYDKTSTDPNWSTISKYDVKADGTIDIFDLVKIATNFT